MNKQKLIKKMESQAERYSEKGAWAHVDTYNAYVRAIGWARELDEPQKPVVPSCSEPWLKKAQYSSDVINLFTEVEYATDSDGFIKEKWHWSPEFYDWLSDDADTLYLLCDALRYGYEVEKEPLYYIKLPSTYNTFLVESDDGDLIVWQNTDKGTAFTEKRIKAIDERYWAFAVPVDEVVEG